MSRALRSAFALLIAVAVGALATAAWAQEATPTPGPSPSPSATASATPSPSPTTTSTPSPTPSASPSPTPTAVEEPTPPSEAGEEELALALDPSTTALRVGERMTVEVLVTNDTSEPKALTLSLVLPRQLGYVSSEPPGFVAGGGPPPLGDFIGVPLGTVPAGAGATATVELEGLSPTPGGGMAVEFEVAGDGEAVTDRLVVDVLDDGVAPPGALSLTAKPPGDLVGQVGDRFDYSLTVANTSDETLENVIVVERVPAEVHVVEAPLVAGVDAVQIGRFLAREDVVWVMDKLAPGRQLSLPWSGVVQSSGDLEAKATARATADGAEPATATAAGFLAAPAARSTPVNPPFAPIVRRVALTVPVAEAPGGAPLPFTGLDAWGWALVGLLITLAGVTLYRFGSPLARGKRTLGTVALLCFVAAACVGTSDEEPRADRSPEVGGRRIERGEQNATQPGDPAEDASEEGNGDTEPDGDDDAGPADDSVEPDTDEVPEVDPPPAEEPSLPPTEDTETIFVTRSVTLADLPVRPAPSTPGSSGSLAWDEGARSLTSATSARTFVSGAPLSVVTTVNDDGGVISVDVSLLNESDDERISVVGRLAHEVGGAGSVERFASDPIDTVLSPGGRVTASFDYLLPSGTYDVTGSFVSG